MNGSPQGNSGNARPFFSVVVPAYNAAETLAAAIESVQGQTARDWELIVVDDGSVDETRAVAESAAESDERIRVISQPNAGCGAARDTGIRAARAEWIVRFDADDILLPDFLRRIREVIGEHPDVEIVSPSGLRRYPDGTTTVWCPDPRYAEPFDLSLDDALHGWCPVFTHSVFRRSLWERIGGIRPDAYAEDYDFWARALAAGARGWYLPEPLSIYDTGNAAQMSARSTRLAESYLKTLECIAGGDTLKSEDAAAVARRIGQLRRRVGFRRAAQRLLGERAAERLAAAIVAATNLSRRQTRRLLRRS